MKTFFKNLWKMDGFRIFAYAVGVIFVIAMVLSFFPAGNEVVEVIPVIAQ